MTDDQGRRFLRSATVKARAVAKARGLYGQIRLDFVEDVTHRAVVRALRAPPYDPSQGWEAWVALLVSRAVGDVAQLVPQTAALLPLHDCRALETWASRRFSALLS